MSSNIRPENAQNPSSEIKQEEPPVEQLSSGNAKQDPPEHQDPSDAKQPTIAEQPAASKPDQNSKSTAEELKPTEQAQEAHHEPPVADKGKSSIAEFASSAALGMKDNVFSMFGGGAKKEKKETADDPEEPSGSANAQKESKAEAEGEASLPPATRFSHILS